MKLGSMSRDGLLLWALGAAALIAYLVSVGTPPTQWSYTDWLKFGAAAFGYLIGKLQSSPLASSTEIAAGRRDSGRALSVLLIVGLALGSTACASLGNAKRTAAISVVSADAVLSAIQDTEMGLVCGRPAAPAAPLCVPLDRHKEISGHLAEAFKYDRQIAQLVKALPDGAASPDVASLLAQIRALVARVLALIPDSSRRTALVANLGGV